MKLQFISIFLLIFSFGKAQDYKPMLLSDNNWLVTAFVHGWGEGDPDSYYDYRFRFTDNQVEFDGQLYEELEYRTRYRENNQDPPWVGNWIIASFYLREDVAQKKVWVYYAESDNPTFQHETGEFLLYDFNLEIGDSIPIDGFTSFPYGVPAKITNITYEWIDIPDVNWQVKTFWLDVSDGYSQIPFVLYEGIGNSHGIVNYELTWDAGWELTGFDKFLNVKEIFVDDIKIYPNPFTDNFKIKTENPIRKIELYDESGRLIIETRDSQLENTSLLSQGIYILKIYFENKTIQSYKLIKTKTSKFGSGGISA